MRKKINLKTVPYKTLSLVVCFIFLINTFCYSASVNYFTLRPPAAAVAQQTAPTIALGDFSEVGAVEAVQLDEHDTNLLKEIKGKLESNDLEQMAEADELIIDTYNDPGANPTLKKELIQLISPRKKSEPVLRVIKATKPDNTVNRPLHPVCNLSGQDISNLEQAQGFQIRNKEDFLRLANEVFPTVVMKGMLKKPLVVFITIREINPQSNIAYGDYLRELSAKYNGKLTFLLSVQHTEDFQADFPGLPNAVRMAMDIFGGDFIRNHTIISMLDAGEKTRWGNLTPRYGHSGIGPARRGDSSIEQNINTLGALLLAYPGNGADDIFNIASDSDIILDNVLIGQAQPKDLVKDRKIVLYGIKRNILNKENMELIDYLIGESKNWGAVTQLLQKTQYSNWQERQAAEQLKKIIRKITDEMSLPTRGVFLTLLDGRLEFFEEKIPAVAILRAAYNNAKLAEQMETNIYENLWLITYNKDAYINFIKRLAQTPTSEYAREKSGHTRMSLLQLEVSTFQMVVSARFKNEKQWDGLCARLIGATEADLDNIKSMAKEHFQSTELILGEHEAFIEKLAETESSAELKLKSGDKIQNLSQIDRNTINKIIAGCSLQGQQWLALRRELLAPAEIPIARADLDNFRQIAIECFPNDGIYGGDYGKHCQAEDTGDLKKTLTVWERERGQGTTGAAIGPNANVSFRARVTAKNCLLAGRGKIFVGDNTVLMNSHIATLAPADEIALPAGAVVVDSYLSGNVKYMPPTQDKPGYLLMGVWFMPGQARELMSNGEWKTVDKLILRPDESVTTIYIDGIYYIIRDIISLDFKDKKIGELILRQDWGKWVEAHPNILGVKGVSETWEEVRDLQFINLLKYPGSNDDLGPHDVRWAKANCSLIVHNNLTRNLRSRIAMWSRALRKLSFYARQLTTGAGAAEQIASTYHRDFAGPGREEISILKTSLESMLDSADPNERFVARVLLGEMISIDIQWMAEFGDMAPRVIYEYLKLKQAKTEHDKEKAEIIRKIIKSCSLEHFRTSIESASYITNGIDLIEQEIKQAQQQEYAHVRWGILLTLYGSGICHEIMAQKQCEPIKSMGKKKADSLWSILYAMFIAGDNPNINQAITTLIKDKDNGLFADMGRNNIYSRLKTIANQSGIPLGDVRFSIFAASFSQEMAKELHIEQILTRELAESILKPPGLPSGRLVLTDRRMLFNVEEATRLVMQKLQLIGRTDISAERVKGIIDAHVSKHAIPPESEPDTMMRRFAEQAIAIDDLIRQGSGVVVCNPYEIPGAPPPVGLQDMTEIIQIIENTPEAIEQAEREVVDVLGGCIPEGSWPYDIGIVGGKRCIVLVLEIQKAERGEGRFTNLEPIIQYYSKKGACVFTEGRDAEGRSCLEPANAAASSLTDDLGDLNMLVSEIKAAA